MIMITVYDDDVDDHNGDFDDGNDDGYKDSSIKVDIVLFTCYLNYWRPAENVFFSNALISL